MKTKRECTPPLSERLMDVKQDQNKEGKTVLYLVFDYMDTDLKKYILIFRQTGGHIPPATVKNLGDNDVISIIIESLGEKSDLLRHEGKRFDRSNIVGYGGDEAVGTLARCVEAGGGRRRRRSSNSDVHKSEYSIEWVELVQGSEINRTMMIAHTEDLVEDIVKVGVQNGLDTHFLEQQPWISARGNKVVPLL